LLGHVLLLWIDEASDSTYVLPLLNKNFAMQWALMTLLDPANSYANLVYVGYPGEFSSAFTVTRKRRVDRKKQQTQRNVFQCFVFGARGSGKTSLLQSFIGRYMLHFLLFYHAAVL
jgi:polynucleotide 5'-kinase involved in rRNA processing